LSGTKEKDIKNKHELEGAVVEDVEIMGDCCDPGGYYIGDKRIFAIHLVKDGKRFVLQGQVSNRKGNNGWIAEPYLEVRYPKPPPVCYLCGKPITPHDEVYDGKCSKCRNVRL